ncbi:hypothetical protein CK203_084108 [Vitis vinifera]|uniref:Chromo domain-containing protein n=1 Tax=Vitis vinifera TaxID=29760 RepID=A0A438FJX5_VITVI|nr:hypothetical protein CK203_084108 [Vitis vinifera]
MGHSRKNRRTDFLVQWKGISETEASWERDVTLWQFEKEVQAYWQSKSTRASTSVGGGAGCEISGEGGMSAGQNGSCETSGEVRMLAGQNFGYEISEWNEGFPSGWNEGFSSGWNEEFLFGAPTTLKQGVRVGERVPSRMPWVSALYSGSRSNFVFTPEFHPFLPASLYPETHSHMAMHGHSPVHYPKAKSHPLNSSSFGVKI